jgi:hypothetical protein
MLMWTRRPTGLSPGQSRSASVSLMTATGRASAVSASVRLRPAFCGIPIVRNQPGVMGRTAVEAASPAAGTGRSAR